jgi:UDP-N-acetyl-2-amino-2-deoxyglucuronate dehydrogenase
MGRKIFNISIAGCSRMAHLHAMAISSIPNARLSGVWSRTKIRAEDFAEKHHTKAYESVRTMVSENRSDLVVVSNAHPFHRYPAVEAANAGANILVEKPIASSLTDCDEIIYACEKNKVRLGVISQRRWMEPVKRVKEAIMAGKIGNPVLATVTLLGWRDKDYYDADEWRGSWDKEGGGVLVNQSPHQLDIMLWMMGDVDEVYGQWKNLNHPYIEVDDTAVAIVKFKSGALGNILVSNSQKPGIYGKVHIHGDNGSSVGVQTDGGAMFLPGKTAVAEPPHNDIWTVPGEEDLLPGWIRHDTELFKTIDAAVYYIKCQISEFLEALDSEREPLVTGRDGRKVVELFTSIYRSARDNNPVKFPLSPEPGFDGRGS